MSDDETRVPDPQSCAGKVVWQHQFGPQDPNQTCWHPKTNSLTCWRKLISPVMSEITLRKPGEEPVVAKSMPTLNLVSRRVNRSPMLDSGCTMQPGELWNAKLEFRSFRHREFDVESRWTFKHREIDSENTNRLTETRLTHHNEVIFNTPYTWERSSNVQHKLSRPKED